MARGGEGAESAHYIAREGWCMCVCINDLTREKSVSNRSFCIQKSRERILVFALKVLVCVCVGGSKFYTTVPYKGETFSSVMPQYQICKL